MTSIVPYDVSNLDSVSQPKLWLGSHSVASQTFQVIRLHINTRPTWWTQETERWCRLFVFKRCEPSRPTVATREHQRVSRRRLWWQLEQSTTQHNLIVGQQDGRQTNVHDTRCGDDDDYDESLMIIMMKVNGDVDDDDDDDVVVVVVNVVVYIV